MCGLRTVILYLSDIPDPLALQEQSRTEIVVIIIGNPKTPQAPFIIKRRHRYLSMKSRTIFLLFFHKYFIFEEFMCFLLEGIFYFELRGNLYCLPLHPIIPILESIVSVRNYSIAPTKMFAIKFFT